MAYIGVQPRLGNYQACDAITASATTTFNLLVGGTAIFPQSAQHCLVSLNGVLQAPISSYTISGSTIIFASALTTDDSIDFITILGDTLDLGHPSDDTVKTASLQANAVTGAKLNTDVISAQTALTDEPADTDEFLVSDAGTLKRIDYSLIKGGGSWVLVDTQTVSGTPSSVESGAVFSSTYDTYVIVIRRINFTANGGFHFYIGDSSSYTTSGYRWNISGVGDGGNSLINGEANANEISLLGETNSTYHVNTSQDCLSAVLWIHNPYNSNRTSIHGELAWENATDVKVHLANIAAHPGTDKSYDRWKVAPSTGNFEATTIIQTFGVINA